MKSIGTKKILVWLSGGVDSAVSAYLLKEQGYDVSAGFMINYLTPDDSCPTRIDMAAAREVAEYLQIPFFTFDFTEEYEKRVLRYIFDWYAKWLTPNPDVFCNTWIKFDLFLQEAISYGFDAVATGHYVRLGEQVQSAKSKKQNEGLLKNDIDVPLIKASSRELSRTGEIMGGLHQNLELLRWVDDSKDQSYFLSALRPDQLEKAMFPIGHLPKSEVREIARKAGLPNAERKDSQGLCFVGKVNFSEFLKSHIPAKKWPIVDAFWVIVGEHDGAFQYTIGQRKGIGVGGWPALFVVDKDVTTNTITVWPEDDPRLFRDSCMLIDMNWFVTPSFPLQCEAQIRYRQKAQEVIVKEKEKIINITSNNAPLIKGGRGDFIISKDNILVVFDLPQRAITPGQVCVLYDGERVLGSGIIS